MTKYRVGVESQWIATYRDEQQARTFAQAESIRLDALVTVISRSRLHWRFCCAFPDHQAVQARTAWEEAQKVPGATMTGVPMTRQTMITLSLNEINVYELPAPSKTKLSSAERDELLQKVVDWKVAHSKLQEAERSEHQVVLVRERRIRQDHRETISVDEYGLVTALRPGPSDWDY